MLENTIKIKNTINEKLIADQNVILALDHPELLATCYKIQLFEFSFDMKIQRNVSLHVFFVIVWSI